MILAAFFFAVLVAPMLVLRLNNGEVIDTPAMLWSSLALALCLYAAWSLLGRRGRLLAWAAWLAAVLVRCTLAFLYDFSGRGFGIELFLHLDPTSLQVGLDHYDGPLAVLLVLLALALCAGRWLAARTTPWPRRPALAVLALAVAGCTLTASALPEVQLGRTWARYAWPAPGSLPEGEAGLRAAMQVLSPIRGERPLPVSRDQVRARAPAVPRNLLVIYLESFNQMLTDPRRYPGLTPRLHALQSRLAVLGPVYASAYLTIEGIANSQCGTLMNMAHANNSLITRAGRLPYLPCLGDVLARAGYRQVYLGGADADFAGKGSFLREHGFDRVLGWDDFADEGHEMVAEWGLSDAVLFDQALDLLDDLRARPRPYHLAMLTLGTHLPGFVYEGCPPYGEDGEDFLDAVHCTDFLVGRFFDELGRRGILDDTVVLLQADHGVFENPDMRALFGDDVEDKRLLTLLHLPPGMTLPPLAEDAGASVDTAATLLEVLGIEHNVHFLLGRSLFAPAAAGNYQLTRRQDHVDGQVVVNRADACDQAIGIEPVTLPLDDCGKRAAMDALASLNNAYAVRDADRPGNRVCALGVRVTRSPSNRLRITFGNEDIARRVYHRGNRVADTAADGVYALLVDGRQVRRALYFAAGDRYDLWRLKQLVDNVAADEGLLLVRQGDADVPADLAHLWPALLDEAAMVYAEGGDALTVRYRGESSLRFVPDGCDDRAGH